MKTKKDIQGPSFEIEAGLFREGFRIIAGADEAGRGPLAGPLTVGFVIYDAAIFAEELSAQMSIINDSKKLTHVKRVIARTIAAEKALVCIHEHIPHDLVDKLNPNRATCYALEKLLERSPIKPDILLMDGTFKFNLNVPFKAVKKGDALSVSIASASLEAKVSRDELMDEYDTLYPGYGFAANKGYGTAEHMAGIASLGISPIHRLSYEPVKSMISDARL